MDMSSKESMFLEGFTRGFIDIYRSHECLWKLTSKKYTNKYYRGKAYKELVEYSKKYYPEANNDFVRQKYKSLRRSFKRQLNKVLDSKKSATCADDVYIPKLWYYDLLLFMVDNVLPHSSLNSRRNSSNNEHDEENSIEEIFGDDGSECSIKLEIEENEIVWQRPTSVVSLSESDYKLKDFKFPTSTSQQSATNGSVKKEEEDFVATCTDPIKEINKTKKTKDIDVFDELSITWGAKIRKLNEEQMVLAESLINDVLEKAYFNELTRATQIKDD